MTLFDPYPWISLLSILVTISGKARGRVRGVGADYPSDLWVVNFLSDAKILASRILQLNYVWRVTASERLVEKLFAVENSSMFFNQSLDSRLFLSPPPIIVFHCTCVSYVLCITPHEFVVLQKWTLGGTERNWTLIKFVWENISKHT